jgi:hypothetical protein
MPNWNSWTTGDGDDARGEVDEEQRAEETGEPLPDRVLAPVGEDLHDRHQECQADGERDEEEVISDRDAELPAIEQHCHGRSPERACPRSAVVIT